MSNRTQKSKMLQNQTHFLKAFTFDFLHISVTLHEPVEATSKHLQHGNSSNSTWLNWSNSAIVFTVFFSAIVFAGEVVSVYCLTPVIVTPHIRSTCCPVRPENNTNFVTEVRWTGSSRIQILATHCVTRMLQFKLPMIRLCLIVCGRYLLGSFMFCMHVQTEIISK